MVDYVTYKCQRYYVQSAGMYYSSGNTRQHIRLLHRQIWTDHNGEIPEGHHIHHKDGNWRNNDISNLECISAAEHGREHMEERFKCPEKRKKNKEYLDKARIAASNWHGSDEGRQWHSEHAKKLWENAQTVRKNCGQCGGEFDAYHSDARFCSRNCMQNANYKTRKVQVTCAACGVTVEKHRAAKFCSYKCSNGSRKCK